VIIPDTICTAAKSTWFPEKTPKIFSYFGFIFAKMFRMKFKSGSFFQEKHKLGRND
jgi:hypothetical protein